MQVHLALTFLSNLFWFFRLVFGYFTSLFGGLVLGHEVVPHLALLKKMQPDRTLLECLQ